MEQLQLLLRDQKKQVSLDVILSCSTFNSAIKLCKEVSGLTDDQICLAMGYSPSNFSLIWNKNGNKRHFPENDLIKFMEVCGNKIPLIWLNHKCGYGMIPLKSEEQIQIEELQKQLNEKEKEIAILVKYKKAGVI